MKYWVNMGHKSEKHGGLHVGSLSELKRMFNDV